MGSKVDLAIIGSGGAAFAAAIRATGLGKSVVMIERSTFGGTCVNTGCIPSKSLLAAAEAHGGVPDHDAFLAGSAAPVMERLLLMSPVDGTLVYDRVGSTIVSLFGHDPTGRRLDEIDNPGIRPFKHRYVDAAAGDRPVFTIQHQVNLNSIGTNERLLLLNTNWPTGTLPASKRVTKGATVPGGIKARARFTIEMTSLIAWLMSVPS